MKMLLMRHGIAEFSSDDFHRPLTYEGVEGVKVNAAKLKNSGHIPNKIFASPLIRAQQTAFIMAEKLGIEDKPESLDLISPESDVQEFVEFLAELSKNYLAGEVQSDEIFLFISHQPFVGLFVHHLTCVEEFMDTADINCLSIKSFSKDGGELEWIIGRD
ncbi:MAG: phosphohistidine phosphatase SixA [Flavobacterium sp.]|jgi:phosphohistidine phosphatase SixA